MDEQTSHKLIAGRTYAVTPTTACTISTGSGIVIITAQPGSQAFFVAPESIIYSSDPGCLITETFKGASVTASGGGSNTSPDIAFSPLSENAQSGIAVQQAIAGVDTSIADYGLLSETLNLSDYTINANGRTAPTDEIWFELGEDATEVIWPESWIWLGGEAPELSPRTAYRISARQESAERILADVAYSYDTTNFTD